jgi:predicted nuclease with TOPRIM domain
LFEPDELRQLTIKSQSNDADSLNTENMPRRERHQTYTSRFIEDSGLSSFEEFAFLQHFVFTFDEQRKTLFFNQRVLERTIYRVFGLEPDMATRADTMRREIGEADSQVRNSQWEATRHRKRISKITEALKAAPGAQKRFYSLTNDHELLTRQFDEEYKNLQRFEDALNDANLRLAELSVHESGLRDEYARYFDRKFDLRPPIAKHPLIIQSLEDHACGLCGNEAESSLTTIRSKASASNCPLCDSLLSKEPSIREDDDRLREIDSTLMTKKKELQEVMKTLQSIRVEEAQARQVFEATKEKLDEFDRENSATLAALRQSLNAGSDDISLNVFQEQLTVLEKEKTEAYNRRERLKKNLLALQSKLEEQFFEVENVFVPRFAELAKQFLGMPLTVEMDAKESNGLNLVVKVGGNARRQQQQLSESQRFFLDIALRMALTEHMSDPASRGGMYIDTPEGSLDIAYEKRAGDMLAMFAEAGHRIVMTANLNSSQLLLALGRRCGKEGMKLVRMTDWSELSQVQQEEEGLFNEAYRDIEQAMESETI